MAQADKDSKAKSGAKAGKAKDSKPAKGAKDAKDGAKDAKDGGKDGERRLSPTAKRAQARREERLEMIRQQVEEGTLTIRQMTPEERKANPPQPRKSKKKR